MASEYWTIYAPGVVIAYPFNFLGVNNGSSYVVKIRRVGLINSYYVAVAGVLIGGTISRYSGGYIRSGFVSALRPYQTVPVTPLSHDSNYDDFPDTIEILSGGVAYGATESIFRRFIISSDEPFVFASTVDEIQTNESCNTWMDAGEKDSNVQMMTLNSGEMFSISAKEGGTAAGYTDVWAELVLER